MTVAAPPRPPRRDDPEALIEEARQRARRRRAYGALALLALLVAGAIWFGLTRDGGATHVDTTAPADGSISARDVSLEITLWTGDPNDRKEQRFTLRCDPPSGSLPLAERVCREIRSHPEAMLAPAPSRGTCMGGPWMPVVDVRGTAGGRRLEFGGRGCEHPGGVAVSIYLSAALGVGGTAIDRLEPYLRCEEPPIVHGTGMAGTYACLQDWPTRAATLILLAKQVPAIAALPPELFPASAGARPCLIPVGPDGVRRLRGTCGVWVARFRSKSTKLTFAESWPGGRARHIWRVTVEDGHARLTGERGPQPPQRWK
jgi:hypothetical protein